MPVYILKKPLVLSLMVIVIALFVNVTFISLLFIIWFFFLQVIVLAKPVGDIRPFCINACQNKFKSFEQTLEHFKSKS